MYISEIDRHANCAYSGNMYMSFCRCIVRLFNIDLIFNN